MHRFFKKEVSLLILILAIFLFFIFSHLLTIPSVWPDEALHSDIALNILKENRYGTDLWKGLLQGVENFGFGYPPLYFYTLAGWFKIFGFSIQNLRLYSILIGTGFIITFYFLLNLVTEHPSRKQLLTLKAFLFIGLILDIALQKASRIGRPEILVVFLGTIATLFFYLDMKNTNRKFLSLSGILLGLALITHYLAWSYITAFLLFFLITEGRKIFQSSKFYAFLIPVLMLGVGWIISINPHLDQFIETIRLQSQMKPALTAWFWTAMVAASVSQRIVYLLYLLISWEYLVFYIKNREKKYLLLLLTLISTWIFTFVWKVEYAFVIIVPQLYLALWILLQNIKSYSFFNIIRSNLIIWIAFILILLNLAIQAESFIRLPPGTLSYNKYTESILKIIPDNNSVYISAIPDPYFGFKQNNRHNSLVLFPMMKVPKEDFIQMLNSVDYIIYNDSLDKLVIMNNYTLKYMDKNAKQIYQIFDAGEYPVSIIELKPKEQRVIKL